MTNNTSGVSRRTLAKGAAWSVPTVAVASAAPALAASPPTECTRCSTPLAGGGVTSAPVIVNRRGTLLVAGAFTGLFTGCTGLISGGIVTTHRATLTMQTREGVQTTYSTTANLGVGAHVAGVATLGSGIAFSNVAFPSGIYADLSVISSLPTRPVSICFDVSVPIGIGGAINQCSARVCFRPSDLLDGAAGVVGALTGAGSVTYGGAWIGSN